MKEKQENKHMIKFYHMSKIHVIDSIKYEEMKGTNKIIYFNHLK